VFPRALGSPRPVVYAAAKWDFAIALGVIFAVIGVAVVVSGIRYLSESIRLTLRSRTTGSERRRHHVATFIRDRRIQ
jgi:hypothetical protein